MNAFWTRGRDTSAESENAAAAGPRARLWRLTAVDRCDRCGAQAYVRVLLPGRLELLFCAHHNRQYSSALVDIAVEIQDETMRLACCALSEFVLFRFPDLGSPRESRLVGPPVARRAPAGSAPRVGQPVTWSSSSTSMTPRAIQAAPTTASCSAHVRTWPVSVMMLP